MLPAEDFQRLEAAVHVVARHKSYDYKPRVVQTCVAEVEQRYEVGALSQVQRARLLAILMGQPPSD